MYSARWETHYVTVSVIYSIYKCDIHTIHDTFTVLNGRHTIYLPLSTVNVYITLIYTIHNTW